VQFVQPNIQWRAALMLNLEFLFLVIPLVGGAQYMGLSPADLRERLVCGRPVLLDGATGTELTRRGVETTLPLWSAAALVTAPEILRQIHADYAAAGADILTANTFRTHRRNLRAAGWADRSTELTRTAVEIARSVSGSRILVAGSLAPLEDCYSPELVPADADLAREHALQAESLATAGVDLILVETQNTLREALAATRAATATGLPVLVSFVCGPEGRLLSGEALGDAVRSISQLQPVAVLVNCAPAPDLGSMLVELCEAAGPISCGAYGNIGRPDPIQGWQNTTAEDPQQYAGFAQDWLRQGLRIIGGCCGTTPQHIALLKEKIQSFMN